MTHIAVEIDVNGTGAIMIATAKGGEGGGSIPQTRCIFGADPRGLGVAVGTKNWSIPNIQTSTHSWRSRGEQSNPTRGTTHQERIVDFRTRRPQRSQGDEP